MTHPAELDIEKLMEACDVVRTRRRGPGGQHRNKVETAIVITHRPTGIRSEASERRSQHENLPVAVDRLRVNLALAVRTRREDLTSLWKARCRHGRVSINASHKDFAALLALVLDVVCSHDFDVRRASAELGCSTSQLVKLLKLESRALKYVNSIRLERNLRPYR